MTANKDRFKSLLKKVGSGTNTSHGLSREESAEALNLILNGSATPAQIGAFMIAHRIRRPEPQELAGMLDTYLNLGPKLESGQNQRRPVCFGMPFDGRERSAPIYPITTLILLSAGQPVVLHGGKRMPVKYGVTSLELFQTLGLDLENLELAQVQKSFEDNDFALIHQPDHFPLADTMIGYRDELGKRPPLASMELLWTPHEGNHLLISGFVHPSTELRAWKTMELLGEKELITVKGLEGSTDLPVSRACITARVRSNQAERLILHPQKYQCFAKEVQWVNLKEWKSLAFQGLDNSGPLMQAIHWNAGTYLWLTGTTKNLQEGIQLAQHLLISGSAKATLKKLIEWRRSGSLTD